jgi:hypothetical protein
MKITYLYFLVLLLFVTFQQSNAQDHKAHEEESHHKELYASTLGLFVGYTFIPNYTESGETESFVAPTIGLDYIYKFNHKIGLALLNDLELASYEIETEHNEETLKREYAFVSALVFMYEPIEWWSVFAGPGFEYEHHKSFFLGRIGTEFIKRFNDGWAVTLTFMVDIKEINTTPALGITILKGLGKTK